MPGKTGMGLVVLPDRRKRGAGRRGMGMGNCSPRNGNKLSSDSGATVGGVCHSGNLVSSHQIGIALDGELEDRGRNGVVDGSLRVKVVDEGMDEAGVESVAGGNASSTCTS